MDGMTINHIVSIDHGSHVASLRQDLEDSNGQE